MGQRGQLDRIPVAHAGPILSLDWAAPTPMPRTDASSATPSSSAWMRAGLLDDLSGIGSGVNGSETWGTASDTDDGRMGWLASGGLDRTVKVGLLAVILGRNLDYISSRYGISRHPIRIFPERQLIHCTRHFPSAASCGGPRMSAN